MQIGQTSSYVRVWCRWLRGSAWLWMDMNMCMQYGLWYLDRISNWSGSERETFLLSSRAAPRRRWRPDDGQAKARYGMVMMIWCCLRSRHSVCDGGGVYLTRINIFSNTQASKKNTLWNSTYKVINRGKVFLYWSLRTLCDTIWFAYSIISLILFNTISNILLNF